MSLISPIIPDWPRHPDVRAAMSTRSGGVSVAPFDALNLATHVGDDPMAVDENRRRLSRHLDLPAEPCWIEQVHGTKVVKAETQSGQPHIADASWTDVPGTVCAVMVADCLPVLIAHEDGKIVAAVHAGWRGLLGGIISETVRTLDCNPKALSAWLGPAIGPDAFEVGPEVREQFLDLDPVLAACFRAGKADRCLADIAGIARRALALAGVSRVFGGSCCTHARPESFFSFRRDGRCGRMAALIWLSGSSG